MAYQKLLKNKRTIVDKPLVTVGSGDVIYLNTFVMRNYFKGIEWVELLYDDDKKRLGINPLKNENQGTFRLGFSSQKNKSTGVIAARSVIKSLKIIHSTYDAKWNDKEKILEVELKKK